MDADKIRTEYFREHLEEGLRNVLRKQREIAQAKIYGRPSLRERTGMLMYSLDNSESSINVSPGGGMTMRTNVPIYMRFLDMKENGNLEIYNRQIWGILYAETLKNIKYEYRDWLEKHFPEMLEEYNNHQSQFL